MKAYPDAAGPGMISSLNPPPFSKQTKIRATNKMTAQAQVESGGTTYFYSPDQQVSYSFMLMTLKFFGAFLLRVLSCVRKYLLK